MAALARSPNEKKSSGGKTSPSHFLLQLAAALDNSTIKSLQWHEDGRGILLHTKLYEEEIQRHQELFPEIKNLKSVSVLQAWLATYGFKARTTKTDSDILSFQHPDFKKLPSKAEEVVGPKVEVLLLPKQSKKSKKRKNISILDIPVAPSVNMGSVLSPESSGKSQRLRPLYQYINYDNPEMNSPPEKESERPQAEVPPVLENKTGHLELRITPNIVADDKGKELRSSIIATSATAAKPEVDKSTQVDIDKMLSVCAAHLVPPLSPQYK